MLPVYSSIDPQKVAMNLWFLILEIVVVVVREQVLVALSVMSSSGTGIRVMHWRRSREPDFLPWLFSIFLLKSSWMVAQT